MNTYEHLLIEAEQNGISVKEAFLLSGDGRCKGNRIAIRKNIPTLAKKADVLAEELAHVKITVGNIKDQTIVENRKQERKARLLSYKMRLPLLDIVASYRAHCSNTYDMSVFLDVSEDTIVDALELYRQVYGKGTFVGDYYIQFDPTLQVHEYYRF